MTESLQQPAIANSRTSARSHLNLNQTQCHQVDDYVRDPLIHNPLPMTATAPIDQPGETLFTCMRYLRIVDYVDRTHFEQPCMAVHVTDGVMSISEVN